MKALVVLLTFGLSLTTIASTPEILRDLPSHLEIISYDSLRVTLLNKNTGLARELFFGPEPCLTGFAPRAPWEPPAVPAPARYDTCFSFVKRWRLPSNVGLLRFADCDRDGLTEVASATEIFERPEGDSLFRLQATFAAHVLMMDYGGDADGDGRAEKLAIDWYDMDHSCVTLVEAPDSISFPSDSVFAWPLALGAPRVIRGGFTDIDGDGTQEISFRLNNGVIYALENTGDNAYVLDYAVATPDSLIDNYHDYQAADFDGDGRIELATVGGHGQVLCYEHVSPDSFAFVWQAILPVWNTFWLVGPADLDADSLPEFYCMSLSVGRGGCFFYGFEPTGDNSFVRFWADSLPGNVWDVGEADLGLADLDGDGAQELYVGSVGWLGVYAYRTETGRVGPVYLRPGVYTKPFAFDTDHNGRAEVFIEKPIPAGRDVYEFSNVAAYRGDINSDCLINGMDIAYFINYFKGWEGYDLPTDIYAADPNGNCRINGVDVLYLISFLKGGPPPVDRECP